MTKLEAPSIFEWFQIKIERQAYPMGFYCIINFITYERNIHDYITCTKWEPQLR